MPDTNHIKELKKTRKLRLIIVLLFLSTFAVYGFFFDVVNKYLFFIFFAIFICILLLFNFIFVTFTDFKYGIVSFNFDYTPPVFILNQKKKNGSHWILIKNKFIFYTLFFIRLALLIIITLAIILMFIISSKILYPRVGPCDVDSDCELVYSNLEEPCSACDFSDKNWVCLSKEMAKQEQDRRAQKYKGVLCERCAEEESNLDKFECQCNKGACVKDKKY